MYQDKTLICKDCGKEFVFTAGEQEFYAEKGFENEPQRCRECRQGPEKRDGSRCTETPAGDVYRCLRLLRQGSAGSL